LDKDHKQNHKDVQKPKKVVMNVAHPYSEPHMLKPNLRKPGQNKKNRLVQVDNTKT